MDENIIKHRMATATVRVLRENGQPSANREVEIEQIRHNFPFGCSVSGSKILEYANSELRGAEKDSAELFLKRFLDVFNYVTLPIYWGYFEVVPGKPDTKRYINTARLLAERGCTVKGHPLCWHTGAAHWLLDLNEGEILRKQIERIKREVSDFKEYIKIWDAMNEVVIMPVFEKYDNGITRICRSLGRYKMIRTVFDAARSANPNAVLLLCDFDTTTAFEVLIEGCLEAGIKLDAIGYHTHMHQGYWGKERILKVIENLARFKVPIHFTEITLVSGQLVPPPPQFLDLNDYRVDHWPSTPAEEERQAREIVDLYTILFSHSAVSAITWWELADGEWLKAPAGLLRDDYSRKPAYDELFNLVKKEWWQKPMKARTDDSGKVTVRGFLGTYALKCGEKSSRFNIGDSGGEVSLKL
ncbi:MAG: endo-1,4-beta-xylanase [Spirochaetales bacterium]|nr:endo-1,4-beta-xylanase [Spirochaetales bacterium]